MGGIFSSVLKSWKCREKEVLIGKSGSTSCQGWEKVRAGQSYLYKSRGMESEVIELRFKEKVSGSFLNQALNMSNRRYPYMNTSMIELDGDFYIVQNPNSMVARRSQELKPLGGVGCGGHLVDITYCDRSVYFSFHHALCDGRGIKPYIETIVYYYCKLKYNVNEPPEGVRLSDDPMLPGETADPFAQRYEYDKGKDFIALSRDALHLPESAKRSGDTDYRYELKLRREDYLAACKRYNATPVILLTILMSRAILRLCPECRKNVNANIASDMRAELGLPNTYKNCVRTLILPYSRELAEKPMRGLAAELRRLLDEQRDRDMARRDANSFISLSDRLDKCGSYEEKSGIMGFFEDMSLDTYIVSYLGQFNFGKGAGYIEEAHLYNSGAAGLGINMLCAGDSFTMDFKQSFGSSKYVDALCEELSELGLSHSVSACIPFTTPNDSIIRRK